MSLSVGDLVVCVDAGPRIDRREYGETLQHGETYTVTAYRPLGGGVIKVGGDYWWDVRCFRPAERTNTKEPA